MTKDDSHDGTCGNSNSNSNSNRQVRPYPTAGTVPFPYKGGPYPQQAALIDALLRGIPPSRDDNDDVTGTSSSTFPLPQSSLSSSSSSSTRVLVLESPTGTGKSLSLACAGLAWLEYEEGKYLQSQQQQKRMLRQRMEQHLGVNSSVSTATTTTATTTGLDWVDSWQPNQAQKAEEEASERQEAIIEEDLQRYEQLQARLESIRLGYDPHHANTGDAIDDVDDVDNDTRRGNHHTTTLTSKERRQQRRENILRQELTKCRMEERKRLRWQQQQQQRQNQQQQQQRKRKQPGEAVGGLLKSTTTERVTLQYELDDTDDDDDDHTNRNNNNHPEVPFQRRKNKALTPGSADWLLQPPSTLLSALTSSPLPTSSTTSSSTRIPSLPAVGSPSPPPPQIIYAARTHSQLSQFIQEVRTTHWGTTLRVVALAGRGQGLCGQFANKGNSVVGRKSSISLPENRLADACLDLRKGGNGSNKTSQGGCPYYSSDDAIATLALHSLTEPTDVEDMARLGLASTTCAYYATRKAIASAQLIVVPYPLLCGGKSTRSSLGLIIHSNMLVLIDEAHNLPSAISSLQSVTVSLRMAVAAMQQLDSYLERYMDKLSSQHLHLLGRLKVLVRGIVSSMGGDIGSGGGGGKKKKKIMKQQQQQNGRNVQVSTNGGVRASACSNGNVTTNSLVNHNGNGAVPDRRRYLQSSSQFLVSQNLETINLFPILRYMQESRLSQKLLGFMPKTDETVAMLGQTNNSNNNNKDRMDMAASGGLENKVNFSSSSNPSPSPPPLSSHISPMSIVETFLEKLTYARDDDGQVVVDTTTPGQEEIQFCVLNPAVHANDDLWTIPRAVCLVGGTLQPLNVLIQELVPQLAPQANEAQREWNHRSVSQRQIGSNRSQNHHQLYMSDSFWAFTCDHVVDPSHVMLQALTAVDGTTIDVRYKNRSNPAVCTAIGRAIVSLCRHVPHGVVVFLPSYKYEQILVDSWHHTGVWAELQKAAGVVLREPKEASQVEATLSTFAKAAIGTRQGALLLSVVGGKLSEGINFADDLCRCVVVVGLPFADKSDPLLQEKLKLVANPNEYYTSLCLRAVNQSVGRAIRHANDYATIVLMDVRYPQDDGIANGLPSWLTKSTPQWRRQSSRLLDVLPRIDQFFQNLSPATGGT